MAVEGVQRSAIVQTQAAQSVQVKETNTNIEIQEKKAEMPAAPQKTDSNDAENKNQADARGNLGQDLDNARKAVEKLNKRFGNFECLFDIHDETNRVMIKVVDKDTKEVIREFPPEKTLEMIAKVWELAGILVDEKR